MTDYVTELRDVRRQLEERLVEVDALIARADALVDGREHAVPCRQIGCRNTTWHLDGYCTRHQTARIAVAGSSWDDS